MNEFWDGESDPVKLPPNAAGDEIQIRKVAKRGRAFIDIRKWYIDKRDGEKKPGRGITIAFEQLKDVLEAIDYVKGLNIKGL
jgi:hypothetical protein